MIKSDEEILNATDEEIAAATNEELATALMNAVRTEARRKIRQEVYRRKDSAELTKPFNPKADISADAQYLWKRIFIWFWVVPAVLGVLAYIVAHM